MQAATNYWGPDIHCDGEPFVHVVADSRYFYLLIQQENGGSRLYPVKNNHRCYIQVKIFFQGASFFAFVRDDQISNQINDNMTNLNLS